MTKREVFQLMVMIASYYDSFVINQEKVDTWFKLLERFSFEVIEGNLLAYVTESPYPPKLSDLVKKPAGLRVIPSCVETEMIILQEDRPASPKVVQTNLAKMRKILGITRSRHSDDPVYVEGCVEHVV